MSAHDENAHDDAQFALFLQRQGTLAQHLQSLEQPAPPAGLDAAILANVERDLAGRQGLSREASNDAVIPNANSVHPGWWGRWRMPLGLAASVAVAVLAMLQWQMPGDDMPTRIAMAPEPPMAPVGQAAGAAPPPVHQAQPQAPVESAKPEPQQRRSLQSTVPPTVIAQAEIPDHPGYVLRSAPPAAPAAAPNASPPVSASDASPSHHGDQHTKAGAKYPAKLWLEMIEELLKADLRHDALQEWKQFQQSYPRYPVPEKLKEQLDSLADK